MSKRTESYKRQAEWLRALAHPTRLLICEILSAQGECCVCHLTAIVKQRQPYVSQHLMVLRDQGLVLDRRDGVMVFYRLADPRISHLLGISQAIVDNTGEEMTSASIPEPPVEGCSCPVCLAAH